VGVVVQVFGHRGACGYLPENTMESFELAFELGCEAIEFDVVLTKDSVPVIRHDLDFSITTDIETRNLSSNYVDELNFSELESVRAIERYPETRNQSASRNGEFRIPSLAEVFANPKFDGKHLIVELKYGKHFRDKGFDLIGQAKKVFDQSDFQTRGIKVTIECFEFAVLREAKQRIGDSATYVFLSAPDMLPAGRSFLDDELLSEIAENFDGLSVHYSMVLGSDLVVRTKAKQLLMYTYTARVETAEGQVSDWFRRLADTGVDGIFCDQPDLMIKLVRGSN
jgi:glycerophosphoryl diester phosphodiesterase